MELLSILNSNNDRLVFKEEYNHFIISFKYPKIGLLIAYLILLIGIPAFFLWIFLKISLIATAIICSFYYLSTFLYMLKITKTYNTITIDKYNKQIISKNTDILYSHLIKEKKVYFNDATAFKIETIVIGGRNGINYHRCYLELTNSKRITLFMFIESSVLSLYEKDLLHLLNSLIKK